MVCHRVLTWAHISGRKDNALTRLHDPDAPDPPVDEFRTSELGAMLRESRVTLGRKLEDVAAELRIRLVFLQAIEEGHLDDLPGITYATGFLRAYANFLGLDGEDLVRRFKAAGMAVPQATDLHLPSPVEDGRLPTGLVLLVAALLAVGAYGGWYYMSSQDRDPIEKVAALPERLAELVGIDNKKGQIAGAMDADSRNAATEAGGPKTARGTAPAAAPSPVASVASANDAALETTPPAKRAAVMGTDRMVSAIGATQAVPPHSPRNTMVTLAAPPATATRAVSQEPPPAPKRKPAATTIIAAATGDESLAADGNAQNFPPAVAPPPHRVVLRANIDTWVEVAAAEEVPVLSRLMREGETFVLPARPGLMMTTGNAGGIEILINGKAIPRLGPVGEILINIALDVESLLGAHTATP